ncbi:MAG: 2-amino-4-hydroxy-6-hydroxymethyldihydropteridine diphosphokinase [Gammaproteobacteria bacterium]
MTRAWLGVGSNVDRERHIRSAINALRTRFGELVISPVYDSAAVGFDGQPFLNLVVGIDTDLPVGELAQWLRALEAASGRTREAGPSFNDRTLDIDILTWGDFCGVVDGITLPRGEILRHAFVLRPLADVAPGEQHPALQRPYRDLLAERDFSAQPLHVVPFALP